jgi:putative acetyltransferase
MEISLIQPGQVEEARRLIYSVAHGLFHPDELFDEVVSRWDAEGTLSDLEDIQANYFDSGGIFLVMLDGGRMIGTGALRRMEEGVGEVKRLWLLPEYHGQALGYRIMQELFAFARQQGYRTLRLETDAAHQARALAFYRRLGFTEIPRYGSDPDSVALELTLSP